MEGARIFSKLIRARSSARAVSPVVDKTVEIADIQNRRRFHVFRVKQ
jgi:hypothetical protein